MTPEQLTTLKAALLAATAPTVVAALTAGDHITLENWCNTATTTLAWNTEATSRDMFEAMDVAKYDNITQAGKREAWRIMLDFAPVDFSRSKNRKAVQDIWGDTDSVAVLQAMRRPATNVELLMGSTDATTNTVTAKKLNWVGTVSYTEIGEALSS